MEKDEIKLSDKYWEKVYKFKCKDGYIYSFVFGQKEVFSKLVALEAKIEVLEAMIDAYPRQKFVIAKSILKIYEDDYTKLGKQHGLI